MHWLIYFHSSLAFMNVVKISETISIIYAQVHITFKALCVRFVISFFKFASYAIVTRFRCVVSTWVTDSIRWSLFGFRSLFLRNHCFWYCYRYTTGFHGVFWHVFWFIRCIDFISIFIVITTFSCTFWCRILVNFRCRCTAVAAFYGIRCNDGTLAFFQGS